MNKHGDAAETVVLRRADASCAAREWAEAQAGVRVVSGEPEAEDSPSCCSTAAGSR